MMTEKGGGLGREIGIRVCQSVDHGFEPTACTLGQGTRFHTASSVDRDVNIGLVGRI